MIRIERKLFAANGRCVAAEPLIQPFALMVRNCEMKNCAIDALSSTEYRQIFAFNAIFPFIPDRIWATSLRRNRWPNQRSTDGPSVRTWRGMRHNELKRNEIQKRFIGRIDAFDGGVSKSTQTSYGSNGINGKLIPPGIENGKNMNLFASFDERCELRGEQKDVCRSFSSCRHGSERTNDKF